MRARDWDESDVRVRPGRRGSRPRTKQRPSHADAVAGLVTAVTRGRYDVLVGDRAVTAVAARELGRGGVVVGDEVAVVGDLTGRDGSLARIVRVQERRTLLRRSSEDVGGIERALVANADQLVVVTALADPEPRTRMVDRCLVAAFEAGMDALLCLTKADLADPAPFLEHYTPLDVPAVVTHRDAVDRSVILGAPEVAERLRGRTSVLVGHSGVGKSTLVNALVPTASRAVGHVNAVTGRGRHTSTTAVALALPDGGWVIDTPGVRSFGLGHVDDDDVVAAFADLAEVVTACPPRCTHLERAPGCALDAWLARPGSDAREAARVESLRRVLASRRPDPDAYPTSTP
ncbi:ribosome small subunit-dependent GTPase A [Litorihabitans aurantiacus]|uniref:Small ribosomal subunit biogenesis GTPase RsgA n=1 Tax=Litorihabitans aurantiacus TaxID=1930061 RepID=A0AA37XB55_9MICO|nr:ribosome small subunit-dependent GTPase A [Litorihabitans aurantiacus]GMA30659.1 putative ribosome biogenesis GTPase RsgA [Litorihabitans aurantiacus]